MEDKGYGEVHAGASLARAEIDQQISTARAYPRSLSGFRKRCVEMATLDERVARECIYALPRKDRETGETKMIEGPSARLSEIVLSAYGNCRAGVRILDEGAEYVTAQGYFHDLETNAAVYREVRRRITDRNGKRFSADMIVVTANACSSIALRNVVFTGVPKVYWSEAYRRAREVIAGDAETFHKKRGETVEEAKKMGIAPDRIFAALAVEGLADIGVDEVVMLSGLMQAVRDSEITIDEAFPSPRKPERTDKPPAGLAGVKAAMAGAPEPAPAPKAEPVAEVSDAAKDLMGEPRPMCVSCANESQGTGPDGQPYCLEHMPKGAQGEATEKPVRGRANR